MYPSHEQPAQPESHVRRDQDQACGRRGPAPDGDRVYRRVEEHCPPCHHQPQPGEAGQQHATRPQQRNRDDRFRGILGLDDQKRDEQEHGQHDPRSWDVGGGQTEQ